MEFKTALDTPQDPKKHRVLAWAGVDGQGKTALLEEFERILRRRHEDAQLLSAPSLGYALVDFRYPNNRDIALALLSIREQLCRTAALRFPTFEAACLRFLTMTQPRVNIKDLRARFFSTGSSVLDDVMQAMNAAGELGAAAHGLPGFSLLSKYGAKPGGKAGHTFYTWWNRRGRSTFCPH